LKDSGLILAIDTSLGAVSACLMNHETLASAAALSLRMERGHAEALAPALQSLFEGVDGGMERLVRVAVTIGPGSFTGVRVGVAAARAIGLARDVEVVGISTLSAFAAPHLGEPGTVIVSALEARGGALIAEMCDERGKLLFSGRSGSPGDLLCISGQSPLRLVGPAAPRLALEAWSLGYAAEVFGETHSPDVTYVARLGLLTDAREAPPRPVYFSAEAQGGVAHACVTV
jgi:tRNA threonylcarbamoyladenosine biosynthesis protein TsaB